MPSYPAEDDAYFDDPDNGCSPPPIRPILAELGEHPWGLPMTAPRGGIKYPTPQKENNMATTEQRKTKLKQQMKALEQQLADVQKTLASLERPAEPSGVDGPRFVVAVQFTPGGQHFEYLIRRVGNRYYTTGRKSDDSLFYSWDNLLDWLEGMWSHGPMFPLNVGDKEFVGLGGRCRSGRL